MKKQMNNFYQGTPLSDKCLNKFILWYEEQYKETHVFLACCWDELPFDMQFTVYEDFFLLNRIKVGLEEYRRPDFSISGYQPVVNNVISNNPMPIHLARVEVIREANETYNESFS